jgi:PAS domain S-box-containing protein
MLEFNNIQTDLHFLKGGGESGELIRNFNWEATSIGAPGRWLPEMKSAVRAMLDSPIGISIFLGKELLHLYNDAFIPTIGSTRHPRIMGQPVRHTSQMWHRVEPYFLKVQQGETVYLKDAHITLDKYGYPEECFLDIAYIPLYDHHGEIFGVQCTVIETTQQVRSQMILQQQDERFRNLIMQSTFAIGVFRGKDLVAEMANDAYLLIVGKTREELIGKPLFESLPEIKNVVAHIIEEVMATGVPFKVNEFGITINKFGKDVFGYYSFTYEPARDHSGKIDGFMATAIDITEQVLARKAAEESEHMFRSLIKDATIPTCLFTGRDMIVHLANDSMIELWEKGSDIIGKPFAEVVPEFRTQVFLQLLDDVYSTGQTFQGNAMKATIEVNGETKTYYFDFSYKAVRNVSGEIYGVLAMGTDVTKQVLDKNKLQENEARLELLSNTVPALIFYLDAEQRYQSYNQTFMKWFGVNATEVIGKNIKEFIGEQAYARVMPHLAKAYAGHEERFEIPGPPNLDKKRWLSIVYSPHKNAGDEVLGIIVHATDITESKEAEIALRNSESRFRSLVLAAPIATCLFTGREMKVEVANDPMIRMWGKDASVIGKPLADGVPELQGQPFLDILDDVFTTGKTYSAKAALAQLEVDGVLGNYYFDFTYRPLFNEEGQVFGIIDMAVDVTEQVLVQQQIEANEKKFRALVEESPVSTCLFTGKEMKIEVANDIMIGYWGKDRSVVGKAFRDAVPEIIGQPFLGILDHVYNTGETYEATNARAELKINGVMGVYYFDFIYKAMRDGDGKIFGVMNMSVDVTAQVLARQKLEEKEAELQNAIEIASLGTWSLDLATGLSKHSRRYAEIFGLDELETAAEEALACIVAEDRDRVTEAFENARKENPNGRYDAEYRIINKKDGKRYYIHAIGQTYYDVEGRPVRIVGTAKDVTQGRELQNELATQVRLRTKELAEANRELYESNEELAKLNITLQRSNAELEEFAYIASHDLQEPVRKISTFTQLLQKSIGPVSDQANTYLTRIFSSTDRMTNLIRDVLAFSQVSQNPEMLEPVDLKKTIRDIENDFDLQIEKTGAVIEIGDLPVIAAIPSQMTQLFGNLLSNSLKYTRTGVPPVIAITASIAGAKTIESYPQLDVNATFYEIKVSDNGIGFNEEHADRIFNIFQRLHGKTEFEGTGIGLSICRKIVQRHGGHIFARPGSQGGAVFHILLPGTGGDTHRKA